MDDLIEDTLAPGVVIRRAPDSAVDIRPADGDGQPLVGVAHGAVWARAEPGTSGIDLGHGTLNIVVREGTVLLDAQAGAGLVIVLRGAIDISSGGLPVAQGRAGDALTFDALGEVGAPDPVDATELARDPFVSLNLVLDALSGVSVVLAEDDEEEAAPEPGAASADDAPSSDRGRGKGLFSRAKR